MSKQEATAVARAKEELELAKATLDRVRTLHGNMQRLGMRSNELVGRLAGRSIGGCGNECDKPSGGIFADIIGYCDEMEGMVSGVHADFDSL
jgi:hypothetical protein